MNKTRISEILAVTSLSFSAAEIACKTPRKECQSISTHRGYFGDSANELCADDARKHYEK